MKTNILFIVFAVLAAVTSLLMLITPEFYVFLYLANADSQAELLFRYIGALYGGLAVMAWMSRNSEPSQSRAGMLWGIAVLSLLSAIVTAFMGLSGHYNVVIWLSCALHAAISIWFALAARAGMSAQAYKVQ